MPSDSQTAAEAQKSYIEKKSPLIFTFESYKLYLKCCVIIFFFEELVRFENAEFYMGISETLKDKKMVKYEKRC